MLPSEVVANYFLQKSFNEGISLDQMKLLKLVYIAHGWHCGYFSTPLVNDAVEAWRYGPVIPDLYRKIKHHGRAHIVAPIEGYLPLEQTRLPNQYTKELLDHVWDRYKGLSGLQLSSLTHQLNTPWDQAWRSNGGDSYHGALISNESIARHYQELIANSQSTAAGA